MATNNSGSGIYTEENDELKKYGTVWDNMNKTKNMTSNEISGLNNQIATYEKQYGGNLFDIDLNTFTDETQRQQFLKDRSDYGTLTAYRDTYNSQVELAKKEQAEKESYANTRRMLMERYIPETLQAMGLANTGLAADALLRFENNYNNYVLGAKSESQQAQSNAMQSYRDAWKNYTMQKDAEEIEKFRTNNENLAAIKQALYNGDYDLDFALQMAKSSEMGDYFQKEISNYATKLEQDALANTYREQMATNPSADLVANIEEAKTEGSISQEVYDELMSTYKEAINTEAIKSGRETIKAPNGGEYTLKEKLSHDANEIAHNRDFKEQLNKLGFSDPYDTKIPNGTTFTIKSDTAGANEVNWRDFVPDPTDFRYYIPGYNLYAYGSNWFNYESRTVTYYNGEWYSSEEKKQKDE